MEDGPSAKMSKSQQAVVRYSLKNSSLILKKAGIFLFILFFPLKVIFSAESIRIITTNDIHTYLKPLYYRYLDEMKPWGEQSREGNYVQKALIEGKVGGMAHVASVIKRLKAETPGKNLVLDAGDTWHGAGISLFDRGVGMVKAMNALSLIHI